MTTIPCVQSVFVRHFVNVIMISLILSMPHICQILHRQKLYIYLKALPAMGFTFWDNDLTFDVIAHTLTLQAPTFLPFIL